MLLSVSICMDDLTKEKLFKAKNGKTYANLSVSTLKEPNQWGKDVQVYEYDKENKKKKFVGNGKVFGKFENQQLPQAPDDSDVPF